MSTISLRQVTKRFDKLTAVDRVDLDVAAGEVVCLLGPSGCGKTTTLRMIAGLESASEGDVVVARRRVNDEGPAQRDIAMVFQFYALYPSLTVRENLAFPLHAEAISAAEREERVMRVARTLDLVEVLGRIPGRLAEGEKQRVAVGRAIVRDPSCFLFDEPLSRLDVELRQQMRGKIKEVLNGLSKATVIVTHDQLEALTMADRIAVMRDGRIEQVASPHEIFARPANLFVASFIGTPQMNLIEAGYAGDGRFAVDGREIRLPVEGAVAQLRPGGKVTLGIRPRAFELASEAGADTLAAEADLIEPMGAETLIHMVEAGRDIRVVVDRTRRVGSGTRLHLRPKPGQVHLFDDSGKRVQA
ncbi:MAG TPA: ABC transporter ATP-binding protein [Geminicoccaceae bacterium]|nr:ABC transporter ATP-binding protein [Geminicoccus sp.]HMU51259.1 ABC transporter ATP-binding protein [Geminicoccaceae bacterium]